MACRIPGIRDEGSNSVLTRIQLQRWQDGHFGKIPDNLSGDPVLIVPPLRVALIQGWYE